MGSARTVIGVSGIALACTVVLAAPCSAAPSAQVSARQVPAAMPTPVDPASLVPHGEPATVEPDVPRRSELADLVGPAVDLGVLSVSPQEATYGTGIVITVRFDRAVPWAARRAVAKQLRVKSSRKLGSAGWAWTDARTALFRPRKFWPGHAQVRLTARASYDTVGTVVDGAGRSVALRWAGKVDHRLRIGRSQVITVNAQTDRAVVLRDGRAIRTMPVSLGKPGWETRSGVKVLMDRYPVKTMTSGSIGAEEEYSLDVPFAIRLTASGEFMHGAPWAVDRIGRWNGSHGCTNLLVSDAEWLYTSRLWGDPVITTGTNRGMTPDNGMGGAWNVPWKLWSEGGRLFR